MLATHALFLATALAAVPAPRDPSSFAPCENAITNCLRQEVGIVKCECKQGALVRCNAIGIPLVEAGVDGTEDLTFYRWERLMECPRHGHLQQCNMGRCVE
ncbi:hypothetical protein PSPO01_08871 [Paraphaeosphaeria sporulosa]